MVARTITSSFLRTIWSPSHSPRKMMMMEVEIRIMSI